MTGVDVLGPAVSMIPTVLGPLVEVVLRNVWWIAPSLVLGAIVSAPMPGRGPASTRRDSWRAFKYGLRREVMARAGHRCEAAAFLAWGRCSSEATEVDHVYPWSRGGPTVASNGQALCSGHNRSKGAWTVPWWYLRGLEKRRRSYFPAGADVQVRAVLRREDEAARLRRGLAVRRQGVRRAFEAPE